MDSVLMGGGKIQASEVIDSNSNVSKNNDDTYPTITNISKRISKYINVRLEITGKNISKYAITKKGEEPLSSDWKSYNFDFVDKNGEYTVWVKDAMGNITSEDVLITELVYADIKASVSWKDDDNKLGYRPDNVIVELYQSIGEQEEKIAEKVIDLQNASFCTFKDFPKTDNHYNNYYYSVKITFPVKYLRTDTMEFVDVYNTSYQWYGESTSNPWGETEEIETYAFVNELKTLDFPVMMVKSKTHNILTIDAPDGTEIILKQLESRMQDGVLIYDDNYSGIYYNIIKNGETKIDLLSGKYEVIAFNGYAYPQDMTLLNPEQMSFDGKYLVVKELYDGNGTLKMSFNTKRHKGYFNIKTQNNYWGNVLNCSSK